jgi:O-antigen/teichoic acid export membrane protein
MITIGTLASYLAGPAASALTMSGDSRIPFINGLISGIIGVVLGVVLIPRSGIVGAAIAQTTTMVLANLLNAIAAYRILHVVGIGRRHLWIVAAALVSVSVGLIFDRFAPGNKYLALLVVSIPLGVVYLILLAIMGLMKEEWDAIRSLVRSSSNRRLSESSP